MSGSSVRRTLCGGVRVCGVRVCGVRRCAEVCGYIVCGGVRRTLYGCMLWYLNMVWYWCAVCSYLIISKNSVK